jgi:hypothetical protein
MKQGSRARLDHCLWTGNFGAKSVGKVSPKMVSSSPRTSLGLWKPTLDPREWTILVSADTVPREVFRLQLDGTYAVFEEAA